MDEHISEELLERFLRMEVSREEGQRVVSHLIAGVFAVLGARAPAHV
jgi:hypothetical protein